MKRYIILIFMLLPMLALFAQKESRNVNAGNKHYKKEKFVESEVEYRKGLEQNNSSFSANFNLGDALYRQEKYEDAAEQFAKAAALAGPVILLVLGLLYLFASPKEANYKFGYRCYFGMGSVRAWRYSQRLAGILYSAVGLILTLVMLPITGKFRDMDIMDMLLKTVKCGIWEAVIILLTTLAINLTVAFFFDAKGHLRKSRKAKAPEAPAEEAEPLTPAEEL